MPAGADEGAGGAGAAAAAGAGADVFGLEAGGLEPGGFAEPPFVIVIGCGPPWAGPRLRPSAACSSRRNDKTLATRRGSRWSSVVFALRAPVPPRSSVLPPPDGNEAYKALNADQERANKGEKGYLERIVLDRHVHAASVARHDDGNSAAVRSVQGTHGSRSLRADPPERNQARDVDRRALKRSSHWIMIDPVVRRISSSTFVGRVTELAQLAAGLDAAEQGEPGLVLLGGEAGIGKTRLSTELAAVAAARGALVVRGRCLEAKAASTPYAPFVEILRVLLLGVRPGGAVESVRPGREALARLVPEIEPQPALERRPSTADERLPLFYAVLELFGRTAHDRPLLVLIEDLHWADASSLDLLRFIAAELGDERLLILGTFRTDELHRGHPLLPALGELVRLPHVMRLDLPAFTEPEVADQLTGIAGSRPGDDDVRRVFARADGNPFFVEELAGLGAESRLPATLRDVLAARLAALSPDARGVVLAAAAIGREATHELIARIAAVPEEQLLGALREAVDHHLLVRADPGEPAGFAFRHALIQELAYAELLPSERIALHRAIVTALHDAGGSSGEIARHAWLGHDLPTCLAKSVEAADHAIGALAFAEALAHLERALELWGQVGGPEALTRRDQASLWTLAARCAGALGRWSRAADLGRTALADLDPIKRRDERVVVLLELSRWEMFAGDETARSAAILEAAELVPSDPPSALRARVLTDLAFLANHNGRVDEALRLAEEAIGTSRAIGARPEEARALVRLAEVIAGGLMQPEAAERALLEAERIAVEVDATSEDFVGHLAFLQADLALMAGSFARAVEIADAGMARAARAGTFGERSGFLRAIKI